MASRILVWRCSANAIPRAAVLVRLSAALQVKILLAAPLPKCFVPVIGGRPRKFPLALLSRHRRLIAAAFDVQAVE